MARTVLVIITDCMMRLFRFSLLSLLLVAFAIPNAHGAQSTCVFNDLALNEICPAFANGRVLEFLDVGDDAVIFIGSDVIPPTGAEVGSVTALLPKRERTSVVASTRVEDAVLLEQIDENEGLLLEREVQELSGARYELPTTRMEVKRQLGLPETAEIASEDWAEMLRVHAETVLSISALASRFILEQVGLVAVLTDEVLPVVSTAASTATDRSDPIVVETN